MSDFRLPMHVKWSAPLIVSIVAFVVGAWVVLGQLAPIVSTLFTSQAESESNSALSRALESHSSLTKNSSDRFTGRSLFTMPSPPPRPAPPPPAPVAVAPPPPPPPPPAAPAEYTGTKPTGMLGDLVYFGETLSIRVGEEKGGIKVIGVEAPSNVRIEYMRGTYSVPIWTPFDWSKITAIGPASNSPIVRTPASGGSLAVKSSDEKSTRAAESAPVAKATQPAAGNAPAVVNPSAPTPPAESAIDTRDQPDPDAPSAQRETPRIPPVSSPQTGSPNAPITAAGNEPPPALTADQISALSQAEVTSMLARVARARQSAGLDQATQDRLRTEFGLLRERQSSFYR